MWIFDWFLGVLRSFGLLHKDAKMVFLGLDDAGKTTLLHVLSTGTVTVSFPSQRPSPRLLSMEELTMGSIKFRTYDMGGHFQARKIWKEYIPEVNAIVFVVDSCARERFPESKKELDALLAMNELSNVPFAVLGNKLDAPGAVSEEEFRESMGLTQTYGPTRNDSDARPIEVFMCSVVHRFGYSEAFNWLSQFL